MHIIKTLGKSVRQYKKESILAPVFIAIEVFMECCIPLIISRFINTLQGFEGAIVSENIMRDIIIYGVILIIMAFVSLFGGAMAAKFSAKASAGFATNLRHDLYYKIQDFSFANIDKFSTPSLVTRLTTDVQHVQMAYMMIIRTAIRSPMMLIFSLALAFSYHPTLPLIYVAVIPVILVCFIFIIKKAHPLFEKVFKKYDNLNASVQENIRGMRVVKSYVREGYENKKFDKTSKEVCKEFTRAEKMVAFHSPVMMSAIYVCSVLLSFFGAKIVIDSQGSVLNIGDLTSLNQYSMQILMSVMMLSMIFLIITISTESARRIVEVLDEKPTIVNPKNPIMEVKDGSIEFKNVALKYSKNAENYVLSDINLKIKSGETVGIIGGTGSSKTSLIQLISRLYDVTEGEVLVANKNVKEYDVATLRNEVSVVLQKNVLFSGTIKDNLRWGNKDATDEEMIDACKLAQAHDFIMSFPKGYDTYIEQGGTNVSGGQKQRLCIARALLKKPKILILDDSTSAVDTKTDALIRKAFKEFIPDTTKIIIAQRIASVEDADKIIVMDNGKIVDMGSHDKLIKSSTIYQEVYNSQNHIGGNNGKKDKK